MLGCSDANVCRLVGDVGELPVLKAVGLSEETELWAAPEIVLK